MRLASVFSKNGMLKKHNPRGACTLASHEQPQRVKAVCLTLLDGLKMLPWLRCMTHVCVFGFWLAVLAGVILCLRWIDHPVSRIEITGDFFYLQQSEIELELSSLLNNSFYGLELEDIQSKLESKPWVKTARVAREWPSLLRVDLKEQQPVASWNGQGIINAEGQVIKQIDPLALVSLPLFYGEASQAKTMLLTYQRWQSQLSLIALNIKGLTLKPRGAWQINFEQGWTLNLGKSDVEERLKRFIAVYGKRLYRDTSNILAVDARYTQGVAVLWKEPEVDPV